MSQQMMFLDHGSPSYWQAIGDIAAAQAEAMAQARRKAAVLAAGKWLTRKAKQQATEVGTQHAARNLRKQGVPLDLALMVLVGRS